MEFKGKNIEEAVNSACKELEIKKDDLKYEIISSGSEGFLGLVGKKEAVIKVNNVNTTIKDFVSEAFDSSNKKSPKKPQIKTIIKEEKQKEEKKENIKKENIVLDNKKIKDGEKILNKIVNFISSDITVSYEQKDSESILYLISAKENKEVFIGRKGETLLSIQHIISKVVNKDIEDRIKVYVDVENYIEERQEKLKNLAFKLADQVKKTGKSTTVEKIDSAERRIIHITLKDDQEIRTQSIGTGKYRKLVIFPKRKRNE